MFELPKAIITDQTPNKMLYQAAQDAAEIQQQMEQFVRRDEQRPNPPPQATPPVPKPIPDPGGAGESQECVGPGVGCA